MSAKTRAKAKKTDASSNTDMVRIPRMLPAMLLNDVVIFPNTIVPLAVSTEPMLTLVNDSLSGDKMIATFSRTTKPDSELPEDQFYAVGTSCQILKMFRVPDGSIRILVQGLIRIRRTKIVSTEPYLKIEHEPQAQPSASGVRIEGLMRKLITDFTKFAEGNGLPEEVKIAVYNMTDAGALADVVASNLNISLEQRQDILEANDLTKRLTLVSTHLARELKILRIGSEIRSKVENELEDTQREYYLREQLKAIRKELGEEGEGSAEIKEFEKKIEEAGLPAQAAEAAQKELERMKTMSISSAEFTVSRTYIEWMASLPWSKSTTDELDLMTAEKELNEDHYGLEDVKTRILEFLAVRKLKNTKRGPILCFVGPPGVGKTSLGKSIARSMNREFSRLSLGGVRDEAEIRGHRRTYVGALPGRIIQSLRKVGVNNPVFMLDEIDKLGSDFRGDPASALLEVLDPAQNNSFQDHYLDVEFDLSSVFFITTANDTSPIPGPLRDRMEIIEIPSYITDEKVQIAIHYLVPRQIEESGLKSSQIEYTDDGILKIVQSYTREAGVRRLEQRIAAVCRKVARKVATGEKKKAIVNAKSISDYLGPEPYSDDLMPDKPQIGNAIGLAWTPVGGEILIIESTWMPGKQNLQVTGQLGDVMKESAQIALSYLRAHATEFEIDSNNFATRDIHIHVPEGATPKDGPSAGVTLATSLASLFMGIPVRNDLCMTGEITLRGNVLPVGGIREKIVAANRYRIQQIIMPAANEKDLFYVPDYIKKGMKFYFVNTISDVFDLALVTSKKRNKIPAAV